MLVHAIHERCVAGVPHWWACYVAGLPEWENTIRPPRICGALAGLEYR